MKITPVKEQEWPANMPLEEQVDKLAQFLLKHYPAEIKGGAIETAISILSKQLGGCACGTPTSLGVVHRQDQPCYVARDPLNK